MRGIVETCIVLVWRTAEERESCADEGVVDGKREEGSIQETYFGGSIIAKLRGFAIFPSRSFFLLILLPWHDESHDGIHFSFPRTLSRLKAKRARLVPETKT